MNRPGIHYYLLILFLCAISACSEGDAIVNEGNANVPSREELRQAMQYHGIVSAERDQCGNWYFIREGKRCALFASSQPTVTGGEANESMKN